MTLDEVCDEISEGLPSWQRDVNKDWLYSMWKSLKIGGVWFYPAQHMTWVKTQDGFRLVERKDE